MPSHWRSMTRRASCSVITESRTVVAEHVRHFQPLAGHETRASDGHQVRQGWRADPRDFDLAQLRARVWKNEQPLSEGVGSAVQGSPLASVAWLANTLGRYGVTLAAGDIILSGSLVPLEPARPGDRFRTELEGVGSASVSFT